MNFIKNLLVPDHMDEDDWKGWVEILFPVAALFAIALALVIGIIGCVYFAHAVLK